MSAPPMLCAALEIALNRYLALEPEVAAKVGALKGRVIALHALGPDWEFYLCPHRGGVTVLDAWPEPGDPRPDVRISAKPAALLRRAFGGAGASSGSSGPSVQVEGDADLLQRFSELIAGVGFDSEEWLARFVGGGAAHRIDQAVRDLLGWGRRSADTLAFDTAEYLREETRDLAHREDVAKWSEGVEAARKRGEQLAARIERLERRR